MDDSTKFNVEIALEDEGLCRRQTVPCAECEMGKVLGYDKKIDQICEAKFVYRIVKLFDGLRSTKPDQDKPQ